MKQSRNQLKQWFKKFAYPTESQFWDWIDSFFHKDDKIPAGQIDGLQEVVSGIQEGINDRIEEIAKVATNNHEELNNRDLPDQHPISAITELEEALIQIQQKFIPLTGNNGNDSPITGDLFFKGNRGLNSLGDLYLTCGSGRTISLKALLNGNIQIAASGNGNIDLIASGNSKAYYNGQELATKNLLTPISQQLSTAQTAIDEHTGEISHIRKTVTALQGVGGYLTAYDFGTSTPTQQQLTDYALSQIPNITADEIFNGTRVTNLNTGDLWILVNTPNTDPAVFVWENNGHFSVAIATTDTAGIVKPSPNNPREILDTYMEQDGSLRVRKPQGYRFQIGSGQFTSSSGGYVYRTGVYVEGLTAYITQSPLPEGVTVSYDSRAGNEVVIYAENLNFPYILFHFIWLGVSSIPQLLSFDFASKVTKTEFDSIIGSINSIVDSIYTAIENIQNNYAPELPQDEDMSNWILCATKRIDNKLYIYSPNTNPDIAFLENADTVLKDVAADMSAATFFFSKSMNMSIGTLRFRKLTNSASDILLGEWTDDRTLRVNFPPISSNNHLTSGEMFQFDLSDLQDIDGRSIIHGDWKQTFRVSYPYSLINGVKWAKMNLGAPGTLADNETGGMFYQWGKAVGWSIQDPLINSSNETVWDMAPAPTDLLWVNEPVPPGTHIPSVEEFRTLFASEKVTGEWLSLNGVNGRKFTDIETGESIFLPALSGRSSVNGALNSSLTAGYYWTNKSGMGGSQGTMANVSESAASAGIYSNRLNAYLIRCVVD